MPEIRPFDQNDEAQVIALWQECGLRRSWNDPHLDIARKQAARDGLFLVAEMDGSVVGTLMPATTGIGVRSITSGSVRPNGRWG